MHRKAIFFPAVPVHAIASCRTAVHPRMQVRVPRSSAEQEHLQHKQAENRL